MGKSQNLYKEAKKIIPGGTQLLSKRPEMFLPNLWPAYYEKAKGCEIWDLDGNKYIDMSSMGVGSCILGYADEDVDNKIKKAIDKGSMATLNCPEEVELAKELCKIHPWADMARYARSGGEAMAIAVRIARAKTDKDLILFCGYHGWHDWYLASNLANDKSLDGHLLPGLQPKGVPRKLRNTSIPFNYNDTEGFLKLIKANKNKIAAVVMEPIRSYYPKKGFLETIRKVTKKLNIVLIFDEITSGWRLHIGGAHLKFQVYPDMCVFAKAISNGYPMAAIIGRKEIMQAAQDTFISSTYWTERIGPTAALATINKLKKNDVPDYLSRIGKEIQINWKKLAEKHNLNITISGIYPLTNFTFNYKDPLILKTLFTRLMLEKGFLATTSFYASYGHKINNVRDYLNSVDDAFGFIANVIRKNKIKKYSKIPVCHSGFRRIA
ncbi:MAG: aminotransferase class III-fold pyridoxal phosphate-dependent enzyme [Candidatus Omnitrophica bacterium]|nr:aminotransferase class III-fold pyridoxal phosphate-dependent enzyme [Candidatus Omnitrophota bacterium]MDD5352399.1 aminotransferase class III-fold pyridoxal phosphate-dependent enzyme [Candidatus Omnitrophota bacterium]MDD5549997.1 aminotransferase class III-fold pyridoxal phosphate-dependent enzyme [Candidatus Omnitrophota bacterium]